APFAACSRPSWRITDRRLWRLGVLRDCGLTVDSSIFPLRPWMYGVKNARLDIHTILEADGGAKPALTEYPPSAIRIGGLTLPVAGGVYFRLLPYRATAAALRRLARSGRPAIVYLHPWELDPAQPRLPDLPSHRTLYHYWGLGSAARKYGRLLRDFRFGSIREQREAAR